MRNITVSLDEELARWARVQAAEHDMSLSRFLAELLRKEKERDRGYETAMRAYLSRNPDLLFSEPGTRYPTKDEIHDRSSLR